MASPAANIPENLLFPYSYEQILIDSERMHSNQFFKDGTCFYPNVYVPDTYIGYLRENSIGDQAFYQKQTLRPQTKTFLKYFKKFITEFELNKDILTEYSKEEIENKFTSSLSYFLTLDPESLSTEVTEDKSLFYTIRKDNSTFYIDQYMNSENAEDEFVVTSFDKNQLGKIVNGNLHTVIEVIRNGNTEN
jgi:hypothetical protein